MENQSTKQKWYQTTWATVLFLIFFFPIGLFLMWKYTKWPKATKWVVTGIFIILMIGGALSDNDNTTKSAEMQPKLQPTKTPQTQVTAEPTKESVKTAPTQAKKVNNQNTTPASNETISQKNAVKKAKSYLDYTAFSHDGLVAQLEYEQFSHDDAVYGADNSGANWNEQAAKKAKSYLEYSAFSRGGLIEQLKYEKFTQEQAEYGANSVGL